MTQIHTLHHYCCAIIFMWFGFGSLAAVELAAQEIVSGLNDPVGLTHAPGDRNRLFVIEQGGQVLVLKRQRDNTYDVDGIFFDVRQYDKDFSVDYEMGLLGIAFRPDYATSGVFFLYYTRDPTPGDGNDVQSVLLRCTVSDGDPDVANPTPREIMVFDQRWTNHDAGWMAFHPENDRNLYLALGDGGGDGGTGIGFSQATTNHLGSIIRIDVGSGYGASGQAPYGIPEGGNPEWVGRDISGNEGRGIVALPEIYHIGLRNPWRCSFDRETGDLWISDAGLHAQEEINMVPNDFKEGLNFGWKVMEGTKHHTQNSYVPADDPSLTPPFIELDRATHGAIAVIGGYVYRGKAIPGLQGTYIFGDYINKFYTLDYDRSTGRVSTTVTDRTNQLRQQYAPTSFGEDVDGELYFCVRSYGTETDVDSIYRIVPAGGRR